MRTEALSNGYRTRMVFGRHYLQHLRAFIGENLQALGFIAAEDAITATILRGSASRGALGSRGPPMAKRRGR